MKCEVYVKIYLFYFYLLPYGCSVAPASFVEKTILPPLNCFYTSKISWAYLCGSIFGFLHSFIYFCSVKNIYHETVSANILVSFYLKHATDWTYYDVFNHYHSGHLTYLKFLLIIKHPVMNILVA